MGKIQVDENRKEAKDGSPMSFRFVRRSLSAPAEVEEKKSISKSNLLPI